MTETIYNYQREIQEKKISMFTLTHFLSNENYRGVIFSLLGGGFTYSKEVRRMTCSGSSFYLDQMLKKDILKQYNPSIEEIEVLKKRKNMGDKHIEKMVFYKLSYSAMEFYNQNMYAEEIYDSVSHNLKYSVQQRKEEESKILNIINVEKEQQRIQSVKDKMLEHIDFNYIVRSSGYLGTLSIIDVFNAKDFKNAKIEDISETMSREMYEKIDNKINNEIELINRRFENE